MEQSHYADFFDSPEPIEHRRGDPGDGGEAGEESDGGEGNDPTLTAKAQLNHYQHMRRSSSRYSLLYNHHVCMSVPFASDEAKDS